MRGFKRKPKRRNEDHKKSGNQNPKRQKRIPRKITEDYEEKSVPKSEDVPEEPVNQIRMSAFSDSDSEYEKEESLELDQTPSGDDSDGESIKEETEEDEENSIEPTDVDADGELKDTDPFIEHLSNSLHPSLLKALDSSPPSMSDQDEVWPISRNITISMPSFNVDTTQVVKKLLDDDIQYTMGGKPAKIHNLKGVTPEDLHIKSQIARNIATANCSLNTAEDGKFLTEFQNELFSIINNYQDLYYYKQTLNNIDSIRFVYCLHIANHILKTHTRILRHNAKLKNKDDVPDEYRDQGYVRPKILVLLPFKSSAYKVVLLLEKLMFGAAKKGNVMNKKRFLEEYNSNSQGIPVRRPEEYKRIFAGNTDDQFTLGISVTRKALKLYSEFYSSDIILASPAGLRRIIGAQGEKDRDYDFLSSIELVVLDQTEIFLMQNWMHVVHIFDHLHLKLKEDRRTDYSRIRLWSADGHAKFYRQTIIFSSNILNCITTLFKTKCKNYAGKVVVHKNFSRGTIMDVKGERPHTFHKFTYEKHIDIGKRRFDCFVNKVLPTFQENHSLRQVLIYIPSYFDFVRLRYYFNEQSMNFKVICDTSPYNKVAEARDSFCNSDVQYLLYTERYHFFNRITLKGIRHIVFYGLPNFPHYYPEMCNMMNNTNLLKSKKVLGNFTVTSLYNQSDVHLLAAIVGTEKAHSMLESPRDVHQMFTTSV